MSYHRLTNEEFVERFNKLDISKTIELKSEYVLSGVKIKCHCQVCGTDWEGFPTNLLKGHGCPTCGYVHRRESKKKTGQKVFEKYLKENSLEYISLDTSKIYKEKERQWFYCPDCGNVFFKSKRKIMTGQRCPYCKCGISFNNRILFNFCKRLTNSFIPEYQPEWAKPYRYDGYFEMNNKKYIVEMDGEFHKKKHPKSQRTLEEIKAIDLLKNNLAKEHDIEMIRIDCCVNTHKQVVKRIKESKLKEIFDLDSLDWNQIVQECESSLIKQVCKFAKENPDINDKELAEMFGVSHTTIKTYIQTGKDFGLLEGNFKLIIEKVVKGKKVMKRRKIRNPIAIYNNKKQLCFIIDGLTETQNFFKKNFNLSVDRHKISKYLNKNILYKNMYFYSCTKEELENNKDKIIYKDKEVQMSGTDITS